MFAAVKRGRYIALAFLVAGSIALLGATPASATPTTITNGVYWKDSSNQTMKCQGGNVSRFGSDYYWICSDLADDGNGNWTGWNGVYVYKSSDLVSWVWQGTILAPSRDGAPNSSAWVGRPSLLYNSVSAKYVAIFESGGGVSAATSSTIGGNYTWVGRLPNTSGYTPVEINDISAFADGSNAYVVGNNDKNNDQRLGGTWRLRPSDFLAIDTKVFEETVGAREAHSITKIGSTYYWFASGLAGWYSSASQYRTSTSLSGPWSAWSTMATSPSSTNSFNTQIDFVIPVVGALGTTYVYAGDRYSQYTSNGPGYNAWYPLTFAGATPTLNGLAQWQIDAPNGTWQSLASGTNLLQNAGFEGGLTGWTNSGGTLPATVSSNTFFGGTHSANMYNNAPYTSWLANSSATNLTAGTYSATARVYAGGSWNTAVMQIYRGSTLLSQVNISSGGWNQVTTPSITVTSGQSLTVGFWIDGQSNSWFYMDDVGLYKTS